MTSAFLSDRHQLELTPSNLDLFLLVPLLVFLLIMGSGLKTPYG